MRSDGGAREGEPRRERSERTGRPERGGGTGWFPHVQQDDIALAARAAGGDEEAFSELVRRWRVPVYRVARGILRHHEDADEAAQEAFVKAHQALPRFRGESSFKTWIYRIAMNAAFDLRQREASRLRVAGEAAKEPPPRDAARGQLHDVLRAEELALLREAVAALPPRQRATLLLRVQEDLSFQEVADALGCPIGTAKANFHHAVRNLRKSLVPRETAALVAAAMEPET